MVPALSNLAAVQLGNNLRDSVKKVEGVHVHVGGNVPLVALK